MGREKTDCWHIPPSQSQVLNLLDEESFPDLGVANSPGGKIITSPNSGHQNSQKITNLDKTRSHSDHISCVDLLASVMESAKMRTTQPPSESTTPAIIPTKQWSSLFSNKPRNSGDYTPQKFEKKCVDGVNIPPQEVIDAGTEFWNDTLVGFFLGENPSFSTVRNHLQQRWRLKGKITMRYDNAMFFFKFNCIEDRQRILESEPAIIEGQPFIVTMWSPTVDSAREQVLSIPVWVHFTQIPSELQSKLGINWLASLIGELKCFDVATVKRERLEFAKALIEIKPDQLLPNVLSVAPSEWRVAFVNVNYLWKPPICTTCKCFGHIAEKCHYISDALPFENVIKKDINITIPLKIPLQKPLKKKWVPKGKLSPLTKEAQENMTSDEKEEVEVQAEETCNNEKQVSEEENNSQNKITWRAAEQAWIHKFSQMRYSPEVGYYMWVSEEEGESRRIYYEEYEDDDELHMITDGDGGEMNKEIYCDSSWNRKFLYNADSEFYTPNLAALFSKYIDGPEMGVTDDVVDTSPKREI